MRKIDPKHENIFDDYIIKIVEVTEGFYKDLNFTPNQLTTISLIFGCMSVYAFYKDNKKLAVILMLISYYYDCMDGYYARKYNMVTEYGDIYDHFSDSFKFILIGYVMYLKNKDKFMKIIPIVIITLLLSGLHLGCQEQHYQSATKQPILDNFKSLCKNKEWINITKYFGCGTQTLILLLLIYYY
jgi:phosphatidylglycerophosphate synthase